MQITDIITIPFGYLLEWLYEFTSNYGVALILFSLVVKLILLPMSAKSKKSMMKMSRLSPKMKEIQTKYANDPAKQNEAMRQLQSEEGVSPLSGCGWSILPLLILFPLYQVIRRPLEYMLHMSADTAAKVVAVVQENAPAIFSSNTYYHQLTAAAHLEQYSSQITSAVPELAGETLRTIDFNFLGLPLGDIPNWHFWALTGAAAVGLFLLPLISAGFQGLSMWLSQKFNTSVTTNAEGMQDKEAVDAAGGSMKAMIFTMPLMSVFIGYSMPAALTIYWIAQAVLSTIQDFILTKKYRKFYDEEDMRKRKLVAEREALEAEKEKLRAERRAKNPDGIVENTSKKKLQQKQQEEAASRAKKFAEKEAAKRGTPVEEKKAPPSGIPDRPYARGRNYQPDRYAAPQEPVDNNEANEE